MKLALDCKLNELSTNELTTINGGDGGVILIILGVAAIGYGLAYIADNNQQYKNFNYPPYDPNTPYKYSFGYLP